MNMDSRQHFTLPKSEEEEDCNATPEGVVISLAGSNVEYRCELSSEEEELINRLYNLLGDRWDLIAGRFPWRRKEEIENYCKMRYIVTTSSSSHS